MNQKLGPLGKSIARALSDESFIAERARLREKWAAWCRRVSEGSNEQNPEVTAQLVRLENGVDWRTIHGVDDQVLATFFLYLEHYCDEGPWSTMSDDDREQRAGMFLQFVVRVLGYAVDAPTMARFLRRHLESFCEDMTRHG